MPRDYYEVLGVAARRRRGDDQEGVPAARARAAPGRQRARSRGRGEVQGGRRGLRGALGRRAPPHLRRLRPRGPARPAASPRTSRASGRSPTSSARSSAPAASTPRSAARGCAAGRCRAATSRVGRRRSRSRRPRTARTVEVAYDATAPCETCHGNGAEPGTPIVTCPRCQRRGADPGRPAHALRPDGADRAVRQVRRRRPDRRAAVRRPATGAGMIVERSGACKVDVPAGIADGQRIRVTGRGHAGERGGPAGDLYVVVRVARGRALPARRRATCHRRRRGRRRWPRSARRSRCRRSTATSRSRSRPARSRARRSRSAAAACRRCGRGRTGDLRVVVNVVDPAPADAPSSATCSRSSPASLTEDNLRADEGMIAKLKRALAGLSVRLGIRVRADRAEVALAELLPVLRRRRRGARGRRRRRVRRSTRRRASCRRLDEIRALARRRAARRRAPSRCADGWERRWHEHLRPRARRRARVRPPWIDGRRRRPRDRPGRRLRRRHAPDDAAVPASCCRRAAGRRAVRLGRGHRRAGDRRGAARAWSR